MSIEKRVGPFSRSFRSLIKKRAAPQNIKDLKDLNVLRVRACYRHSGPTDLKRTRAVFPVREGWRGPVPRPTLRAAVFYRSAGACPPRSPSSSYVFRSFRTLMSIEKRVVLFSRSFRSLIKKHAATQNIKDLKDLSAFCVSAAIDIQVLQT